MKSSTDVSSVYDPPKKRTWYLRFAGGNTLGPFLDRAEAMVAWPLVERVTSEGIEYRPLDGVVLVGLWG